MLGLRVLLWFVFGAVLFKHVFGVKETLIPLTLTDDELLEQVEGSLHLIDKKDNTVHHKHLIQVDA